MSQTPHLCHATNCPAIVPPNLFMCRRHWFILPKQMRYRIWQTYRPGQETDKKPSVSYLKAATAAVRYLAAHEGGWPSEADTEASNLG